MNIYFFTTADAQDFLVGFPFTTYIWLYLLKVDIKGIRGNREISRSTLVLKFSSKDILKENEKRVFRSRFLLQNFIFH